MKKKIEKIELENNELENNEIEDSEIFGITEEEFLELKEVE